jgi:enoyl-CoA hydratase
MGARTLQRMAAENDARAHLAPGTMKFRENVREKGVKAAISERNAIFGDGRARVNGPEIRDENGRLVEDCHPIPLEGARPHDPPRNHC